MKGWWRFTKRFLIWTFSSVLALMLLITVLIAIYKDDIINYAVGEMNKNLNAKVEVAEIDVTFWATFPNLSLDFNQVFIQDAVPGSTRKDTLLYTDQIRLKFNPWDIWNDRYHVQELDVNHGTVKLKVDEKGQVNYNILKKSESNEKSEFEVKLKQIALTNIRFSYQNFSSSQLYKARVDAAVLEGAFDADKFTMETDAYLTIQRIQNGMVPIVMNRSAHTSCSVNIDNIKQEVSIPDGKVTLAGLPFDFSLHLDSLNVHTEVKAKNLDLQDVANKLTAKELDEVDHFKGSGTVNFSLVLDNGLKADSYPLIDCAFGIKNGKLTEPENSLTISSLNMDGVYSTLNGKGNEVMALNNVSFRSATGPFNGNCRIEHFDAPSYIGKANGSVDLGMLHALFHLPKIAAISGKVDLRTVFDLRTRFVENEPELEIREGSGSARFSNAKFQLEKDSRIFEQINGNLILNKTQAALEDCRVRLGKSDLKLNGLFDHIDGFLQNKSNLTVDVTSDSRNIDLADFTNSIVQQPGNVVSKDFLLPTQIEGDVVLDVRRLKLDDHIFESLHGNMKVGSRNLVINQLYGKTAEASVSGNVSISETAPEYFEMATSLYSSDLHFKPLFKEWNNFDQNVITANNISGRAEVTLDMTAPFDFSTGIVKEAIKAQVKLKVFNGNLKGVSTFKALTADLKTPKTRMVLKKREVEALEGKLDNIKFETLENTIYIKNSTIFIPKMEIHSSALDITTEGTHTFDNKIDYRFAFRVRDLKLKKDESEFGIVEDDGTGIKVFVRMYGDLDDPTIVWDKESKQEQARENREAAKNEAMSILKSEFGLFKKDSTVQIYQPKTKEREVLQIQFGQEEVVDPVEEKKEKQKKETKLNQSIKRLKEQNEKEKQEEFTVE